MREILFRGKIYRQVDEIKPESWIVGESLFQTPCGNVQIGVKYGETSTWYDVYPETVGQFTGLTDKNGDKIWAGDIVEAWSQGIKAIGEIKQRIDGYWLMYPAWQSGETWTLSPTTNGETSVKVIGTIHDKEETP